jgi:predicted ATPase
LLLIGTHRPVEGQEPPLQAVKQELQLHGHCAELALGFLTERDVTEYLVVRFPTHQLPVDLARVIHQRTDGNPLFMVNAVEYLVAQGSIVQREGRWELHRGMAEVEVGVPESLRQMIEKQIARLSPEERRILEVGSVVGIEFSAAAVAAGVEAEVTEVEERCEGLARRNQLLQARGTEEWPDGTIAACYGFLHTLYQEVMYERVTAGRRVRLHQRIGEREEQAYGKQAREVAAELAVHFERGRDYRRAVQYLELAGKNALQRSAPQEAISYLSKGVELLKALPATPQRVQDELTLQIALGVSLIALRGCYAAQEAGKAYARVQELGQQTGDAPQLLPVLWGVELFYQLRVELQTVREFEEGHLTKAQYPQDPTFLLLAHNALGAALFHLGDFSSAAAHLEKGLALYDPQQHHFPLSHVQDPGVLCFAYAAAALWHLGYPDRALQKSREALTLAQELSHPFSEAVALHFAAWIHQHRGEGQAAREKAELAITLSTEHGFPFWSAGGTLLRGRALVEQGQGEEGISQMQQGLAAWQATGVKLVQPSYLALLAEGYEQGRQIEAGFSVLAEALAAVERTGERWREAELYRLKGQLVLQSRSPESAVKTSLGQVQDKSKTSQDKSEVTNPQSPTPNPQSEAEAYFRKAIEIARKQQAKSLELRAVMSLARLWQQQGKQHEARNTLSEIYGWFTEGFDTKDLQEAKALLTELEQEIKNSPTPPLLREK